MADDNEPYDICPYDPSHQIARSKMPFHLMRCGRNHPGVKKETCPYDARHLIDPELFKNHLQTCPKREIVVERSRQRANEPSYENDPRIVPINAAPVPLVDVGLNSWEDEILPQSYNPLENVGSKNVVQNCIGAGKATKRSFRNNERKRIAALDMEPTSTGGWDPEPNSGDNYGRQEVPKARPVPEWNSKPAVDDLAMDQLKISAKQDEPTTAWSSKQNVVAPIARPTPQTKAANKQQQMPVAKLARETANQIQQVAPVGNGVRKRETATASTRKATIDKKECTAQQNARVLSASNSQNVAAPLGEQQPKEEEEWQEVRAKKSSSKKSNKKKGGKTNWTPVM